MTTNKLPEWFLTKLPSGPVSSQLEKRLVKAGLATVCKEARCPNRGECFGDGTATIMIMGEMCTRNCRFCAVITGNPKGVLPTDEPARVARAVAQTGLNYLVITSVDRDDLPDGGAQHFADVITEVRKLNDGIKVEALIPDYRDERLDVLLKAAPDVLGHNVEVVKRLSPKIRDPRASFEGSVEVLRQAKQKKPGILTKSSLMVGLGKSFEEIREALSELRAVDVDMVTIGQYLQPTKKHWPVERYLPPEEFDLIEKTARELGFMFVASGPLVRSSYKAAELFATKHLNVASNQTNH